MENKELQEILQRINSAVSNIVIGKDNIKEALLIALLSQGHVLIEGFPGTAKTTLARTFSQVIGGSFKRIQGTPDMLPSDILGFYMYRPDGSATLMPGPIFANVVLADELNRTTPRTQSALLEAMQEQQVTIERQTHRLEQPFILIGSQTPYGGSGTSPLSDVQLDRFMFRLLSGFPTVEEEQNMLRDFDRINETSVKPATTLSDILQLQLAVKMVHVADSVTNYIVRIVDRLRHHQDLLEGPSPRGSISLLKGARANAFIHNRNFVTPDDVKKLLLPALVHRIRVTTEAEIDKVSNESIINQVASEVAVPKEGVTQA